MLSDQDYLDATELGFFLGDLKAQIAHCKPGDKSAYAQKYFESTSSGMHIVGMPFGYISESNFNRKAFAIRLFETFSGFGDAAEIQSIDFYYLIESLSPNFPRNIVLDVSQCLKRDPEGDGSETVHTFKFLFTGTICNILYSEWLKLISDYYADESSVSSMNALKLKSKLEDFHSTISPSICQPPLALIHSILDAVSASNSNTGVSSFLVEVTLDSFRRALYVSEAVRLEIRRYCQ